MARQAAVLGTILIAVVLLYAHVSGAGFCGYDDFNEGYRAAFFDGKMPIRIVTAVHFEKFMYRPVTSALQLATWQLFGHNPVAFRLRNLAMHLAAVSFVYGIAFVLGRSRAAAAAAAALFGFSPLANEAVVVAIWTNTTAYALLLGSLLLFLLALRALDAGRRWTPALVGSLAIVPVALFTYEPTIVVLGIMVAYLALCRGRTPGIPRAFLVAFIAGCAFDLLLFFGARHVVHIASTAALPVGEIVRDTGVYLVALGLPVDLVLANGLFGTPLPVAGAPLQPSLIVVPAIYAAVLLFVFAIGIARPVGERLSSTDRRTLAFLIVSIPLSLVPIVLYKPHVSEFNLYVPSAFYAIALVLGLHRLCRNRTVFVALVGLLALSYAAGTWTRNERVVGCARTASRIVGGLPIAAWRDGAWHVLLATPADQRLTPRYGIYDYSGIETLEVTSTPIRGAQEALRLATGNERVDVNIVPPQVLAADCQRPKTCFYVFGNGDVKEVVRR